MKADLGEKQDCPDHQDQVALQDHLAHAEKQDPQDQVAQAAPLDLEEKVDPQVNLEIVVKVGLLDLRAHEGQEGYPAPEVNPAPEGLQDPWG